MPVRRSSDVVETAVPRILVLLAIAFEGELAKQVAVEAIDARFERRVVARDPAAMRSDASIAHRVEAIEIGTGVEARVLDAGDQERGRRKVRPRPIGGIEQLLGKRPRWS